MPKIALVSVTLNAGNPMTQYFQKKNPDIQVRNYLDGYLTEKIKQDGGINASSMKPTCITVNPFPGQFIECQLRLPTFKCRFSYPPYIFYHTGVKISAELCCIKPINGIIFLP